MEQDVTMHRARHTTSRDPERSPCHNEPGPSSGLEDGQEHQRIGGLALGLISPVHT